MENAIHPFKLDVIIKSNADELKNLINEFELATKHIQNEFIKDGETCMAVYISLLLLNDLEDKIKSFKFIVDVDTNSPALKRFLQ